LVEEERGVQVVPWAGPEAREGKQGRVVLMHHGSARWDKEREGWCLLGFCKRERRRKREGACMLSEGGESAM
jgi:hypothetical protein